MSAVAKTRLRYAAAAFVLLLAEIFIGAFLHDRVIRPFGGDVLVVILIWALLRIVFPTGLPWLPGAVFLFACAVECAQGLRIFELLGLTKYPLLRIALGTSFSVIDIGCYAAGCIFCALWEIFRKRKKKI